ncbi:hypothetical protein V1509DRAFT_634696 [Lipomyces kononenkoae]
MPSLNPPPEAYFAPTSTEVIVPTVEDNIHDIIGRWTDERLSHPAIVVVPSNHADIIAAVKYAAANKLTLVVGAGGHKVVPINETTLYVDMRKFNHISVDSDHMSVTFGGGVSNQKLLEALYDRGLYTTLANSGAVGMVGFILGGGLSGLSSAHGLVIDNVLAFEGITASGEPITLDASSSTGEERSLFDVLCGAGIGLLAITSVTMRAFRLSSLQLADTTNFWVRKWTFPGSAIQVVADFFKSLVPVEQKMLPLLIFARAPPSAPVPGVPVLILSISYFGPSKEAEAFVDPLVTSEVSSLAITCDTSLTPLVHMFDSNKMLDVHGGFKSQHMAPCMDFSAVTIVEAFQRWKRFGDEVEDARPFTAVIIFAYNPAVVIANGSSSDPERRGLRPFVARDRPVFAQALTWYRNRETKPLTERFITDFLETIRRDDNARGYLPVTMPNNFRDGTAVDLGYTKEQLVEIRRVHRKWNGEGVLYNVLEDDGR